MKPPAYSVEVGALGHLRILGREGTPLPQCRIETDEATIASDILGPFDRPARDLLRIATAVMATDRLCLRRPSDRHDLERELTWHRQLSLCVTLEDPDRWQAASGELNAALRFLTDDAWSVTFTGGATPRAQQKALFDRELPPDRELALFSGGLDSLAGALARLNATADTTRHLILVSEYGQLVRRRLMVDAFNAVPMETGARRRASWLGLNYQLRDVPDDQREDTSQRSRGFLFFSIAAAVATTMGIDRVSSFETGIGALNPPMNSAQVAALNTRSMHPQTLTLLERLFARVLDRPLQLDLPFFLMTKGELCLAAGRDLLTAVNAAVSCDEGERAKKRDEMIHCGFCTSCLFRRSALWFALKGKDPTPYRETSAVSDASYTIEAYRQHAIRFARAAGGWRQLLAADPTIRAAVDRLASGSADRGRVEEELQALARRHSSQVLGFLDAAAPRVEPRPPRSTETTDALL